MDCDGCDEVVGVDASWPCSDDGDPNDGGAGPDEEEWFADSHADVEGWLYAVSLTDEEPCEGIDDDGAESDAGCGACAIEGAMVEYGAGRLNRS